MKIFKRESKKSCVVLLFLFVTFLFLNTVKKFEFVKQTRSSFGFSSLRDSEALKLSRSLSRNAIGEFAKFYI